MSLINGYTCVQINHFCLPETSLIEVGVVPLIHSDIVLGRHCGKMSSKQVYTYMHIIVVYFTMLQTCIVNKIITFIDEPLNGIESNSVRLMRPCDITDGYRKALAMRGLSL